MEKTTQSKLTFWYSKPAMAVYALLTLAIALFALLCGPALLRQSEQPSRTHQEPESANREIVLVGKTVDDLRLRNGVHPLRYEQQSADLNRFSGIYGFTLASFLERNMRSRKGRLLHEITLQKTNEYRSAIEIHRTLEGKVMIVGFVDEATVVRVIDTSKAVGTLYLYHEPMREGQIPVAIPASRITSWDYRAPHEFSEIEMD